MEKYHRDKAEPLTQRILSLEKQLSQAESDNVTLKNQLRCSEQNLDAVQDKYVDSSLKQNYFYQIN